MKLGTDRIGMYYLNEAWLDQKYTKTIRHISVGSGGLQILVVKGSLVM